MDGWMGVGTRSDTVGSLSVRYYLYDMSPESVVTLGFGDSWTSKHGLLKRSIQCLSHIPQVEDHQ
jgi:hypothetical protein